MQPEIPEGVCLQLADVSCGFGAVGSEESDSFNPHKALIWLAATSGPVWTLLYTEQIKTSWYILLFVNVIAVFFATLYFHSTTF